MVTTDRRRKVEVDTLIERIKTEGFVDEVFEDRFEQGYHGWRKNVGAVHARSVKQTIRNRLPGIELKSRTFRTPDEPGGVLVTAVADRADEIFEEYAEGFYA